MGKFGWSLRGEKCPVLFFLTVSLEDRGLFCIMLKCAQDFFFVPLAGLFPDFRCTSSQWGKHTGNS